MSRLAISTRLLLLIALTAPSRGICAPRSNADQPIKVEGIIDRVIVSGSEPVFRAGGYTFRIVPATDVRFGRGLQALSEVGTNTWAIFEGTLDGSGSIVATKAAFARLKLPKSKPDPKFAQVTEFPPNSKIDAGLGFAVGSSVFPLEDHGGWCGWYDIPSNPVEQEHIRSLGAKLVPQYQRDLPADDPARIPFRFYVVEEKQYRSAIFCGNGLILVPVEVVNRLQSEDQLAAVLADGIAGELLLQAARARGFTSKDAAEMAAAGALGIAGLLPAALGSAGGLVALHKVNRTEEHERSRMALSFTADAGLDPRQAPQAWRLLAPTHLPKDRTQLKDPERSLYLQYILDAAGGKDELTAAP
jgi:hypothetical protein